MKSLLCLAVLSFGGACAHAEPPTPLLWKISDADNQIYLLGSFHVLKPSDYPLASTVEAAFADAEAVAFELSPVEMNSPELAQKMTQAATYRDGRTLQQFLSAPHWRQLQDYAQKRELPVQSLQSLEPWFVALLISLTEMQAAGYDVEQGLDRHLMRRAAQANKPTLGLETGADQIAALDSMSATEQQQALAEALEQADKFKSQIDHLHRQWRAGNASTLFASMGAELKDKYPQLYQRINVARNQAWLPKIQRMLDAENRDTLVVVGSLHLLGDEGLVAQLKARGYRVERL